VEGEVLAFHTIILPYIRLESVTKWRIAMALRDDMLLKKIQLMSRIDAQCEFDFFNRLIICATLAEMEKKCYLSYQWQY